MRLHGSRHTYASFGAGSGLGLPIIGRLLGHAHSATTAHTDMARLRPVLDAIASLKEQN